MKYLNILLLVGILATSAHAATIRVNFNQADANGNLVGPTEAGFTNWVSADNNLPANLSATLGSDSLTLSTPSTGINFGTTLRSINRGTRASYTGALTSLSQTWWGQRQAPTDPGGYITINIAGLSAGDYSFTSWHLDFQDQTGEMKIEFSNNGGTSFTDAVSSFDLVSFDDDSATNPIMQSFNFTSTGADVQFRFTNTAVDPNSQAQSGVFSVVNGFELTVIPEPSAALLVGLAAGFGLLRRRRH